ncbi:unnamed protein product [Caretta caretta]
MTLRIFNQFLPFHASEEILFGTNIKIPSDSGDTLLVNCSGSPSGELGRNLCCIEINGMEPAYARDEYTPVAFPIIIFF